MIRQAISPRLAIRIRLNIPSPRPGAEAWRGTDANVHSTLPRPALRGERGQSSWCGDLLPLPSPSPSAIAQIPLVGGDAGRGGLSNPPREGVPEGKMRSD